MANSRTKKTIINTLAGTANRFLNVFLSFALRTVFIYVLGVQYTGVSSLFTDILTMLSLSELGISTAITTALYEPLKSKDEVQIRKLISFYRVAYRYIALFILIIGIILLPFLNQIVTDIPDIKENIYLIFILYIVKTAASYLLIYKTTLLQADQKQYIIVSKEMICVLIRYIVEIVALLIFKEYMLYLIIEVASIIIQNMIVSRRAEEEYPYAFQKNKDKLSISEKKKLFKDIKGLSMYQISASVGNSIDNILVSSFISTTMVGLLSNYVLIRKNIESIVKQFFLAVIPSVGNLATEKNVEKQYIIFNRIFYISFIIVNFCSVSLYVLFNPFINLWLGDSFLLDEKVAFVIAFDFFLYILLQAVGSFRTANGLFVKGQYRPLVTAVLNVILSIFLIKRLGVFGTILATIICRLVTQWYDPYLLFKYVFNRKFNLFYVKYCSYILIFFSGSYITKLLSDIFILPSLVLNILISSLLCLIIPNIWLIFFTYRTSEFKYVYALITHKIKKM